MHAEAVRYDAMPSKPGLLHDDGRPVRCDECDIKYHLHYDSEAETSITFCSILADEIVTALHPEHRSNVVLDLAPLGENHSQKSEVLWSIRIPLVIPLKKKPKHSLE
ncbi:MAG: hypothetical protein JWQ87_4434 [Candidatus Sulfotelmatobacter sp.]|nr:hypothetical protein [Candidatus Sulfotelmatobacter sp.]